MNNYKIGDLVVCYVDNTTNFGTDIHKILQIENRGRGI